MHLSTTNVPAVRPVSRAVSRTGSPVQTHLADAPQQSACFAASVVVADVLQAHEFRPDIAATDFRRLRKTSSRTRPGSLARWRITRRLRHPSGVDSCDFPVAVFAALDVEHFRRPHPHARSVYGVVPDLHA